MNFGSLVVCLHMADELGLTMDDVHRLNAVAFKLESQAKEGELSFAEADKRLR